MSAAAPTFQLVPITTNDQTAWELFAAEPEVMPLPHIAELLNVNVQTVRREIARGHLGCIHVGRCVRVTRQQLTDYVLETCNDN